MWTLLLFGVSWCLQEGRECGSGESIGCKEEYLDRQRDGREVEPIEGGEGALASIGRSYLLVFVVPTLWIEDTVMSARRPF